MSRQRSKYGGNYGSRARQQKKRKKKIIAFSILGIGIITIGGGVYFVKDYISFSEITTQVTNIFSNKHKIEKIPVMYKNNYLENTSFLQNNKYPVKRITDFDIKIVLPKSVKFSEITDEDDYNNNRFKIILKGDYTSYFVGDVVFCSSDSNAKYKKVELNDEGNTEIIFKTNKLQGYKIYDNGDNSIVIKVGNPKEIYDKIVILDPGHGGKMPGTIYGDLYEKDFVYDILYNYAKKYFKSSSDVKAYWTRTSDEDIENLDRAHLAEKLDADLFVSLHLNSYPDDTSVNGTEVYYSKNNNKPNDAGLTSEILAKTLEDKLGEITGFRERGIKTADHTVTCYNSVPAVLIELCFMSNPEELQNLQDNAFKDRVAKAIYQALNNLLDEYPTGR